MKESLKTVTDVMRPGVVSVSASTTFRAVGRVMRDHAVHGVLVVDDDGEPLGWVTARGMLRHLDGDWRRLKAGEALSEPCVRVVPSQSISAAIATMLDADASHLAVTRPGSRMPDGVVSDIDLVGHLSR